MPMVLFVDDEEIRLAPFVEALQDGGHKVIMATDASQAVELAKKHAGQIGVIVMDLMMPTGDNAPKGLEPRRSGLWAIEQIRNVGTLRTVPVIVLSAVSARRVADRKEDLGWVEYLEKPVDLDTFVASVEKHCKR